MSETRKLLESIQNNLNEAVNYNLGKDVEYLDAYEKANNYDKATDACKINAFKANLDLGEDIYAGTVKLEDGTVEQHYFNVIDNGQVRDHSNIFATGTPKEYAGINLSKIFKEKGYTPNPDGSATGPNGEKLDVTVTTNGIIFIVDNNKIKYEDFIKESINEEDDLILDERGLPKLDHPYYMNYYEPEEYYYIRSARLYDLTDYSFATTADPDYNGLWRVHNPNGSLAGTVDGYKAAVELMKKIDSQFEARIDRT